MRTRLFAVMVCGALFAGRVLAQGGGAADDLALKGPSVTDHSAPKAKGTFGPDAIEKKKAGNKSAPPPSMAEFLKAMDVLKHSPTPEGTRLTAEQDGKISSAAKQFESATSAYMEKNKVELDGLRAKLSPSDRNMLDQQLARGGAIHLSKKTGFGGKKGALKQTAGGDAATGAGGGAGESAQPAATAASRDETAKVRARIVEIYAGRPKVEDVQSKILGMLTPEQLPLADAELAKLDARHAPGRAAKGAGKGLRRARQPAPAAPKPD